MCHVDFSVSHGGSHHVKCYREADKEKLNMTLCHGFTYVYARGRNILCCILKIKRFDVKMQFHLTYFVIFILYISMQETSRGAGCPETCCGFKVLSDFEVGNFDGS